MVNFYSKYEYVVTDGVKLFTACLLPEKNGKFPVVIIRTPYDFVNREISEEEILSEYQAGYTSWLKRGYAIVIQHCRGSAKSEGDFIPYINERNDGLYLHNWIRNQNFYNGALYLKGQSYLSSVHYVTAPFAKDIKGAVFTVQDSERYNICYRNGCLKRALHGSWFVTNYKRKTMPDKNYNENSFNILPLTDFCKTVFGEDVDVFDKTLRAPNPDNDFWKSSEGGADARGCTDNLPFPALFATGFNDIYTGGIFDMWNSMSDESKEKCAFIVSPYNHGDTCGENTYYFKNGQRREQFGNEYEIDWFDFISGKTEISPFELGKITYYRSFEDRWHTETEINSDKHLKITLGEDEKSYIYNPDNPPGFQGGLSRTFGGSVYQDKPGLRDDIITVYTEPFEKETFVKGKMNANLTVKSDCEDTCFYIRVSITKKDGDFGLRDDITTLCFDDRNYIPNTETKLSFTFDEHAFKINKGDRLRIDIASADVNHYVRHTNYKGLYCEIPKSKPAKNTICLSKSYLILPIE